MILENVQPFAPRGESTWRHYIRNVLIASINVGAVALFWRGLLLASAIWAQSTHFGLLNGLDVPWGWRVVLTILAFDALTYSLHVAYHLLPALWRLHQVHHTDPDFDVTTASRFHPGEILLSTGVQIAIGTLLGAAPEGIVVFQMLLLFQAQAQHSNVALPDSVDRWVRWVLVTPNMHRIHHSVIVAECNSNYSTILSVWDRIGRTLCVRPQAGIEVGLRQYGNRTELGLPALLAMPFRRLRNPT
jgi:sterol desaturase/sphingolipid hydroxylase (fatty acid hydroxylase superfamily)